MQRGGQPLKRRILHGQGYNPYKEDPVPKWDKIWDEIEKEYDWPEHFVDKRQVCLKFRQGTQIRYDRETERYPAHQMLFSLFCFNNFPQLQHYALSAPFFSLFIASRMASLMNWCRLSTASRYAMMSASFSR